MCALVTGVQTCVLPIFETVRLVGDALVEAIKRKLVEESFEVSDAKTADSIAEELADVQEVIDALAAVLKIQKRKISDIQQRKREKRGGFTDGLMLIRTSIAPPVRGDGSSDAESQQRLISRVEELHSSEKDFLFDRTFRSAERLEGKDGVN